MGQANTLAEKPFCHPLLGICTQELFAALTVPGGRRCLSSMLFLHSLPYRMLRTTLHLWECESVELRGVGRVSLPKTSPCAHHWNTCTKKHFSCM